MGKRSRAGQLLGPVEHLGCRAGILQCPLDEAVEVCGENDTHSTPGDKLGDRLVRSAGYLPALLPVRVRRLEVRGEQRLACRRSRRESV